MTDPLHDIRHYSPTMTISQLMKFCEKKGLNITRAMVQNYIRDEILPPPVNKRFYTHKHLAVLAMIDRLKTVFDMPAIKSALAPFTDEEGISLEIYSALTEKAESLTRNWLNETTGDTLLTMTCAAELKYTLGDNL